MAESEVQEGRIGPVGRAMIGAGLVLGLGVAAYRSAGGVPDRRVVLSVLEEAGKTGLPVLDVVDRRGIRRLDWGQALDRHLRNDGLEKELSERLSNWKDGGGLTPSTGGQR